LAAEQVAKAMGLTTVRDVQLEKQLETARERLEIKNIHQRVMEGQRPKTLDAYIKAMASEKVKVVPTINKANQLQGFRFEHKGRNFKASEVHRSMSGGKILGEISNHAGLGKQMVAAKTVQVLGKTLELGTNLATSLAKDILNKIVKQTVDRGIGF